MAKRMFSRNNVSFSKFSRIRFQSEFEVCLEFAEKSVTQVLVKDQVSKVGQGEKFLEMFESNASKTEGFLLEAMLN